MRRLFPLISLLAFAACSNTPPAERGSTVGLEQGAALGPARMIGTIVSDALNAPALVAPDSASVGVGVTVTVTTIGRNGCWRADGVDVKQSGSTTTLIAYDRVEGEMCTQALIELPRTVELRFATPGPSTIVLEGRDESSNVVRIEHSIVVR